jgi:MerR family transcriptional regulator, light-induced transcriptional regulator
LFTIKFAAATIGVPEATLRTWERRYGVVAPERSEGGYRIYDRAALARLSTMRRLVDAGWSPAAAAAAIRNGDVPVDGPSPGQAAEFPLDAGVVNTCTRDFLNAAVRLDAQALDTSLDRGMSLGSFEHAVDGWLMSTLVALGEGWARGEVDVAAEHIASHAVLRRLSAAFEAAGSRSRGPKVVVGLPSGSHHELGALAFATAARRTGLDVLYLGPNVPESSWLTAVDGHRADAAVLCVVTPADHRIAAGVARSLKVHHPGLLVASGGAYGSSLGADVHELSFLIGDAVQELDRLLHGVGEDIDGLGAVDR